MKLEGGCYCRKVRYVAEGEPMLKAQCHCRECQYISGGSPNMFMLMPPDGFSYTAGTPKQFTRADLERAVTRGILRRMRHASGHAPARSGRRDLENRYARRAKPFWRPADGDLHHRQAGVPSNPRRLADLRAAAETIRLFFNSNCSPTVHRGAAARASRSLMASPSPSWGIGITAMVFAPAASSRNGVRGA